MKQIISAIAIIIFSTVVSFMATNKIMSYLAPTVTPTIADNSNAQVLSATDSIEKDSVTFNVDAIFNKALIIKDKITADNIVYGIKSGVGVGVGSSDPQNPVITNTGVLSLAGKTGELKLEQGSGITIDGLKITNSGIISLTSGTGITVSGSTITNSDLGSSQNIFKTLSVSGQDDIVAGSNTDTLTFTAGAGITLTTDSTDSTDLTITSNDPSIAGGWTHEGTDIHLTTSTDQVGIGTTDPSYKLHVVGTEYVSDTLTAGGALGVTGNTTLTGALNANGNVTLGNATTDSLTFVGRIANGTSLTPDTDLGSDLGSSDLRFDNLWVANVYSNDSVDFSGKTVFSYAPTDTIISQASVLINPTTSTANGQLLGLGIAGYQKALIDEDGDIILGYSNLTSAPVTDYPLTVYGHSGTQVTYIDTSGNLNITGGYSISGNSVLNATTLGTGILNSSLTSTGTLNSGSITSGFGSIDTGSDNIVTTGTVGSSGLTSFTGNSLAINSIASTGNLSILPTDNVGIGTATPTSKLSVVGDISSSVATNVEGLKLTDTSDVTKLAMKWTGTGITLDTPLSNTNNKLSNYGFETDLTGWSSYSLNDQFTTAAPTTLVSGGLSAPSPSLGSELIIDSGFDNPPAWDVSVGQSVSLSKANIINAGNLYGIYKANKTTIGLWYLAYVDIDIITSGNLIFYGLSGVKQFTVSGSGQFSTGRATTTHAAILSNAANTNATADNLRYFPLTLSSLFSTTTETTANKIISAGVTLTAGTQAGLVLNADDTYSNFIIAYHDGTKVYFEKNVGGTYSSIFTAVTATYVADAQLKVIKNGNSYQVVYNNVLIGSGTVSDAGIVAGTKQGLFSTYASNSFSNFLITTNIDGSFATDGTNTRTVTDTKGKLSITGGQLNFATGESGDQNPVLVYPATVRGAGKVLVGEISGSSLATRFGWSSSTNGNAVADLSFQSLGIYVYSGTTSQLIGAYTNDNTYKIAVVQRTNGYYYYVKGGAFTNWTLLYIESAGATASLYQSIYSLGTTAVFTADNVRIPTATWLPTPLAYDTFNRADGAIGSTLTTGPDSQTASSIAWDGTTATVVDSTPDDPSTGKAYITPSLGSEMWDSAASTFESGTYAWTVYGANTIANVSNALQITFVDSGSGAYNYLRDASDLSSDLTIGQWYSHSEDAVINTGTCQIYNNNGSESVAGATITTIPARVTQTLRAKSTQSGSVRFTGLGVGEIVTIDNISFKPLTLSSLFSSVSTSDADVIADVNVTLTAGTQAGLVLNLDDTTTPANFVIAYHDGTKVYFEKNVAGTYTSLFTPVTTTYVAGATLRVIKDGTAYRVYYNNVLIGTATVSDAGIISNTKHGLFSTYSGNSFDNFTLFARGTGNEYVNLPAEDLTATRDTSKYYAGNSSLKLVASTNDQAYTQSVTLPDTSTYNLTAYAYTDGSAVSTTDLDLYYDTDVLTTSFTSVGNGWYKLSGTLTGVASAKNYGVRVHAGKTVYVDSLGLYTTTGGGTVLGITNSTTGLGGLSVESTTTLNSGLASLQALIVKGFSGQTEDLTEWHTSAGSVLASISSTGGFTSEGNLDVNGTTNDIAGTLNLSGNSLTSSGALSITPNTGSNVSFSLSGTGDMIVNTNDLVVDTSLGYVGIGTAAPTALLDLAGTSGMDAFRLTNSGSKVLGLSYGTNAATFDVVSTDPTNKLLNGTFDTDLTSWSEVPSYTLNDQFSDVGGVPAGSVNGTNANPTGGTRTVVDTNSRYSITSGVLNSSGIAYTDWTDPRITYDGVDRVAGKTLLGNINIVGGYGFLAGWRTATTGGSTNVKHSLYAAETSLKYLGTTSIDIGSWSTSTNYNTALVLRGTGAYFYIKGGIYTNWTLLWIDSVTDSTPLYPSIQEGSALTGGFTADNIRIPTSTWLPTPLAYDTFDTEDLQTKTTGPDSQTTPQLTWDKGSDAGEIMKITPSLGSEVLTNAGMEAPYSGGVANGWQAGGTPTEEITTVHGGTSSQKIVAVGAEGVQQSLASKLTIGNWYQGTGWIYSDSGLLYFQIHDGTSVYGGYKTVTPSTWSQVIQNFRSTNTGSYIRNLSNTSSTFYDDDFSLKPLTLSSLFSTVSTSDADVIADADVTVTAGTQAGIVTNLNDTTTPTNFRIIYTDGTTIKMDDVVGGTYTNKLSVAHSSATALNYAAGRTLRVITQGTTMRVYYNNTLVGSEITTLGANTNTKHGLFSTYSENSFDNFTLWPRGSSTTKFTSAPFEELTATRNTTTKYNNSTASVQLVAGGTDANYLQSVNVGDTQTYNLIAYAYTTGAVVSASDLSLYYDTGTLTTTYTPMGATGWYKLSGTLTGEASAKDFGVRVKSEKTVYVDEMHLQVGTGTTQNMYILNSNTGVTGLNVQGLINGTLNGVATLSKAGTISDSDFTNPVDGLIGLGVDPDTGFGRIYFREGGSWSFVAESGGFQIPKEEVLGLFSGDYLLPYVDTFMSDGAVHGLYQKFDLNKLLETQGAVTFVSDVTFLGKTVFNKDTAGSANISIYSSSVDVKFENTYETAPAVKINLVIDATDSTMIKDGQKAYIANITPQGFSIMLPSVAMRSYIYNWMAVNTNEENTTKSQSPIQEIIDNITPTPIASDTPELTITPLP